jgi:hypothetical protein
MSDEAGVTPAFSLVASCVFGRQLRAVATMS